MKDMNYFYDQVTVTGNGNHATINPITISSPPSTTTTKNNSFLLSPTCDSITTIQTNIIDGKYQNNGPELKQFSKKNLVVEPIFAIPNPKHTTIAEEEEEYNEYDDDDEYNTLYLEDSIDNNNNYYYEEEDDDLDIKVNTNIKREISKIGGDENKFETLDNRPIDINPETYEGSPLSPLVMNGSSNEYGLFSPTALSTDTANTPEPFTIYPLTTSKKQTPPILITSPVATTMNNFLNVDENNNLQNSRYCKTPPKSEEMKRLEVSPKDIAADMNALKNNVRNDNNNLIISTFSVTPSSNSKLDDKKEDDYIIIQSKIRSYLMKSILIRKIERVKQIQNVCKSKLKRKFLFCKLNSLYVIQAFIKGFIERANFRKQRLEKERIINERDMNTYLMIIFILSLGVIYLSTKK
ncbi:hypothetical protein ABK040_006449 [Willaertia magna]